MEKSECKDCTERAIGCHSTCEKYKAFREKKDAEIKLKKDFYEVDYGIGCIRGARTEKWERRHRK